MNCNGILNNTHWDPWFKTCWWDMQPMMRLLVWIWLWSGVVKCHCDHFVPGKDRCQGEGIIPRCSLGTHFWVAVSNGCTPKCAEQRSPQGTWYCCLPTHGHCWERPRTNPVETHLLCCFWLQAKQGMCQELVGTVHTGSARAALLQS